MTELIFISSAIQHPRHQKRIRSLAKKLGVTVFFFRRGLYARNTFAYKGKMKDLGFIENKTYYKRIVSLMRLYANLKKSNVATVYCCSVDHALSAILAGKRVFMELGDLHQLDRLGWLYRRLDEYLLARITGLILTSESFETEYFRHLKNYDPRKVLIIENRLPASAYPLVESYRSSAYSRAGDKKILGIIGSIRFPAILRRINEVIASRRDDIELHLYGDGYQSIFEGTDNCIYHGAFRNPDDLPEIYSKIQLNLICYDLSDPNVKLALPNKLYESVAFLTPIICMQGCKLGSIVTKYGLGRATDLVNLESSIDKAFNNYDEHVRSMEEMPKEFFIDDDEKLLDFVGRFVGQH